MNVEEIIEQAIQGEGGGRNVREAIRWAMQQAYLAGVESGIAAERQACLDLCDKIEKEAYQVYGKNLNAYEDGVSAGARACMEEIERRK